MKNVKLSFTRLLALGFGTLACEHAFAGDDVRDDYPVIPILKLVRVPTEEFDPSYSPVEIHLPHAFLSPEKPLTYLTTFLSKDHVTMVNLRLQNKRDKKNVLARSLLNKAKRLKIAERNRFIEEYAASAIEDPVELYPS